MTKRALSLFLALILCLGLAAPALAAGEVVKSGYCGGEGDGTNLSWTLTDDGTLTITGTGKMEDFISAGPWSFVSTEVETVDIQEGVTTIGDHAFDNCDTLTDVTLPAGLTTIGEGAFSECQTLTDVTIPASVTTIGDSAFESCWALTDVTLQERLTTIGNEAFMDCHALTSVTLPESLTTIGEGTFVNCDALTNVTIPASVTTIGVGAFYCRALTSFVVAEDNPAYTAVDGVLFNKDKTTLIQYPRGKAQDTYAVPDGVTTIGDGAFSDCDVLAGVTFPEGLTTIEDYAFEVCDALTDVTFPASLTTIGDRAFEYCTALTSVTLPAGLTTIGEEAFSECQRLTDVTIPASVTTFGRCAFAYCAALTNVTFSEGLSTIGEGAFGGCLALTDVTIPASVTTIGDYAFEYCDALTSFTVAEGNPAYTAVDGVLFNKDKTTLIQYPVGNARTTYSIPDSVTTIGGGAFAACVLANVTIPASVTTIGMWAFGVGDTNMEEQFNVISVRFLGDMPQIDDDDYYGPFAERFVTVYYPEGNSTWTEEAKKQVARGAYDVTWIPFDVSEFQPTTYTVIVWSAQHGKVTANPNKGTAGTKVALTIAPDKGYGLDTLVVKQMDGTVVPVINNTFTMPASDVTITPTFKATTYTVTVWSAQHGKVTASPKESTAGTKVTLTVTPDSGYELDTLTVKQMDGTVVPVTNNTFTMPASDVTITPTFKATTYTVTVWSAQHGKVTASPTSGKAGTKVTLTVTPDKGYELDAITVKQADGKAVTVAADNTFTMPASNVTVSATFKALPVDRLSLNRSSVSVSVGGSASVTATVSGYAGKHVYAISSDTSVATVSVSGKSVRVQGVAQGAASVYVVMADTNAMTLAQAKADPSIKELKVTVTKAGTSGGGSSGGGGGGGASGGSSGGGSTSTTPTTPEPTTPASQTFGDVEKGSWYESGVTFVTEKGLFNGVGANQFAPQQNMTRAMLMTVLARLAGQSTDGGATWYSKGMDWAKAQGISDGTAPEGNITREQLVTMLYRYANSPAVDAAMGMAGFEDVAAISDWAQAAMRWAVQNGILTGKGDARLDPQGLATRAEVATILQRYVEKLGQ